MTDIEFDRSLVNALGRNGRESYPDRSWEEIEPVLRRTWEFDRKLRAWHDVRAAVQAAWRAGAGDASSTPRRGRNARQGASIRAA